MTTTTADQLPPPEPNHDPRNHIGACVVWSQRRVSAYEAMLAAMTSTDPRNRIGATAALESWPTIRRRLSLMRWLVGQSALGVLAALLSDE